MTELDCKACKAVAAASDSPQLVYEDDLWVVRHTGAPYAHIGWLTMHTRRHAEGITWLNDEEAADLGPALRRSTGAVRDVTGALRVYVATLTEATPHFHAHLVPRYADGPKQWSAFGDLARAQKGEIVLDDAREARVRQVIDELRATLASPVAA